MASIMRSAVMKVAVPPHCGKIAVCSFVQKRDIMGRCMRQALPPPPPKPKPFDYINKDYTYLRSLFDRTTTRFDENTKVIVVDGPIAVCKTHFASRLAEDLEMKHFPEANMDYHYITQNGLDLRTLNDRFPEDARTFDHINFNLCPNHRLAAAFQIMMYAARYEQYIDALAHLLNTGQGVVLERSPYSDFVFLEAMYKCGYISKGARSVYYDIRYNTLEELLRPHLVVYLDAPASKVQEFIKKRKLQHEVEGKALTPQFLEEMEHQYKSVYLRDIATHAELLVYDWSGGGEHDVVVEDIERIDFEQFRHREDPKLKDWRLSREMDWADERMKFTNSKPYLMNQFNLPRYDVPELITSADDAYEREKLIYDQPEQEYAPGYTSLDKGSKLFKTKTPKYTIYY